MLSKYRSELMGAAMLWVMLFHAFNLDFGVEAINLIRSAGFGGVDIFILLSAVGLVMSLSRREEEFTAYMARRAGRILPAYYLVMTAYTLFYIWRGEADFGSLVWNATLLYYWVKPDGAFNWYVAGIMLFYAITPFCVKRLNRKKHPALWTAGGVAFGLLICRILVNNGEYWGFMDVFYRVPVLFLGFLIGIYVRDRQKLTGTHILFWLVWVAIGMIYLYFAFTVDINVIYLPLCHLFLFTTVPLCLVLCGLFETLPLDWARKFLRLVGTHSLEIYLFNVSLFAEVELLQSFFDPGAGHYIYYLAAFAANILLGVLLHRAVEWGRRQFA